MPVLTAVDVLGIQRYVFASNKLRDVVAASNFVEDASGENEKGMLNEVEVPFDRLLTAGGEAYLLFSDMNEARKFARRYTRLLADRAPGMEVAVFHKEYEDGNLARAVSEIQTAVAESKTRRKPSVPVLGLSVTEKCAITGLPAVGVDEVEEKPLSADLVNRRSKKSEELSSRWKKAYLGGNNGYEFPLELDKMGRTFEETSLIGIVHVDGNGVGKMMMDFVESHLGQDDEEFREEYKGASDSINRVAEDAMRKVVERVLGALHLEGKDVLVKGTVERLDFQLDSSDEGETYLPLRPILLGGDDITFVCDGRIALDLAEAALDAFRESKVHDKQLYACAGVAIVAAHSPFDRAYSLAESLCRNAKALLREKDVKGYALDWHVGETRPSSTLPEIRRRQYSSGSGDISYVLTCRPYIVEPEDERRNWYWFSDTILGSVGNGLRGEVWSGRRNKIKQLAGLAREGPDAVKETLEAWKILDRDISLPVASGSSEFADNGYFDKTWTPLIDAVELIDIYNPLSTTNDNG